MPKPSKPKPDDLDQSERFVQTAKELGADVIPKDLGELIGSISPIRRDAKTTPQKKPKG